MSGVRHETIPIQHGFSNLLDVLLAVHPHRSMAWTGALCVVRYASAGAHRV